MNEKTKYKIKLYREAPICPKCNVSMKFFQDILVPEKKEEYVATIIKEHKKTLFQCQKCYDVYEVEIIEEAKQ